MAWVNLERDSAGGVVTLTVNRPEVPNAIDVPVARAIAEAAQSLPGDVSVRCIVLRGAGRAFIAGGDLAGFAEDFDQADAVADELLDALHCVVETLTAHNAPVTALPQHLEQERTEFRAATKTADFRAGVAAFLGKQPVTFKGQ